MYCRDIKQWCDQLGNPKLPEQGDGEHSAIADARWNKIAWEFLHDRQEAIIISNPEKLFKPGKIVPMATIGADCNDDDDDEE